jgi:UDP-N-acetyl-D-glucosamine dehydrogenase
MKSCVLQWIVSCVILMVEVNPRSFRINLQMVQNMSAYVVSRIAEALNDHCKPIRGSKIVLFGMAYKKDVDDPRESPGFELMKLLLEKGAYVAYNDPYIPRLPSMRHCPQLSMSSQELTVE